MRPLLARLGLARAEFDAKIAPEVPFWAVGDIHGCDQLLANALDTISDDQPVVFVGDYVDRGPSSAEVLHRLHRLQSTLPDQVICLKGNHEDMMLTFIATEGQSGQRWLRHGGLETCTSFGLSDISPSPDPTQAHRIAMELQDAVGLDLLSWLENLPYQWQSGNVHVTHAGANPRLNMSMQSQNELMWGGRGFYDTPRKDAQWIIHGHVVMKEPLISGGRVAIDIGAYATNRLAAVKVKEDDFDIRIFA